MTQMTNDILFLPGNYSVLYHLSWPNLTGLIFQQNILMAYSRSFRTPSPRQTQAQRLIKVESKVRVGVH